MIRRFWGKNTWWILLIIVTVGIFTLKTPYQVRDDDGFYEWRSFVASPDFAVHKELILPSLPAGLPYAYLRIEMFNALLPEGQTEYRHDIEVYIDNIMVAKFKKGQSLNKRIPVRREILENKNRIDVMVKVAGEPDVGLNHVIIQGDADAKTARSYTVPPLPENDLSLDPGIQKGEFGISITSDYNLLRVRDRLALMLGATFLIIAFKKIIKKIGKFTRIPIFMSVFLGLYLISAILHMHFIYKFKDSCYLEPLYIIDAASYDGLAWDLANVKNFLDWKDVMYASPGWSLVLALIYRVFGHEYLIAKSFLVLFAMIIGWIIFLLGKNLLSARVGYFSSLFYIFSTSSFYFSGILQYEMVLTFFMVLSIFLLVKSIMSSGWKRSDLREHGILIPDEVNGYYFPAHSVAFIKDSRAITFYPLHTLLMGWTMKLFGEKEINNAYYYALFYPAFLSSLTIILVFFIGKVLFNNRIGIFAAATLAFMEYHIFYGKTMMAESSSVFFGSLAYLFTCLFYRTRSGSERHKIISAYALLIMGAISLGLGLMAKPPTIFFIIPIIILIFVSVCQGLLSVRGFLFSIPLFVSFTYLTILGIHKLLIFLNLLDEKLFESNIKGGLSIFFTLGWNPYWKIPPFLVIIWNRISIICLFLVILGVINSLKKRSFGHISILLSIPAIILAFCFWVNINPARYHVSIIPFIALLSALGADYLYELLRNWFYKYRKVTASVKLEPVIIVFITFIIAISGFINSRETIALTTGYARAAQLLLGDNFNKGLGLDNLSLRIFTAPGEVNNYQPQWCGQGEIKELDLLDASGSVDAFLNAVPGLIQKGFTHLVFDFCYAGWVGPGGSYMQNVQALTQRYLPTSIVPNPGGGYRFTLAENSSSYSYVLSLLDDPIIQNIYIYRLKDLLGNNRYSLCEPGHSKPDYPIKFRF